MPVHGRRWMVVKASQRELPALHLEGRAALEFGRNGMEVSDAGVAQEIDHRYGEKGTRDVVVVPHYVDREPGHRYVYTVPEMPWKRKVEDGHSNRVG